MTQTSSPPAQRHRVKAELTRGWPVLVAATIGFGTGVSSLPFYTSGLFVPELEAAFGWSRGQLSAIALYGSLVLIATAPLVGALVDRFGVRVPATISILAVSAAYFAMSVMGGAFAGYLLLSLGMYTFASASTPVSFTRAASFGFDRLRGVALGVVLAGAGATAFLVPATMGTLIARDWRAGFAVLGLVALAGAVVTFLLINRTGHRREPRPATPFREVIPHVRTWLFARLTLAFAALALAVGGMPLHLVPLLRDAGVSPAAAAGTASLLGIALIIGRVGVGLLVDRFFAPRVTAAVVVLTAAGFAALLLAGPSMGIAAALAVGLALGAEADLIGYLTSRYFGLRRYGRIFGLFYMVFMAGIGFGPVLIDSLRAATGGYSIPLLASIALLLVAAVLFGTAPRFPADPEHAPAR